MSHCAAISRELKPNLAQTTDTARMNICVTQAKFSIEAYDELLSQWQQQQNAPGPLRLDLSRIKFIDPYGLCGLVIFLNHLPDKALPVRLQLPGWPAWQRPRSRNAGQVLAGGKKQFVRAVKPIERPLELGQLAPAVRYLTRMGFWEEVGDRLYVRPEQVPVRPLWLNDKSVLLDITIMHTHDSIAVMMRKTGDILQNLGYSILGRGHVLEVLSELSSNALLHSQSDFGGVTAMQTYKTRGGARYVVMSIGDHGIGVRASLAANPKLQERLESDSQALGIAVQMGASRYGTGGHGGGLPRVLDIARRYGGRVAFRSGTGALSYNGTTQVQRVFATSHLQGTQLRIALPEAVLRAKS